MTTEREEQTEELNHYAQEETALYIAHWYILPRHTMPHDKPHRPLNEDDLEEIRNGVSYRLDYEIDQEILPDSDILEIFKYQQMRLGLKWTLEKVKENKQVP